MLNVFVYGTLKPGESNYQYFCAGKVIEEKSAIAFGQLFDLPLGYPAMILGENLVQGFLLTFADPASLSLLDKLEDYDPQRTLEENEYYRQQIKTYSPDGEFLALAWAYLMTSERVQHLEGVLISSGHWSGILSTKSGQSS